MRKIKLPYKIKDLVKVDTGFDLYFLILVLILSIYGTLMVFSAGYAYAEFRYDDGLFFVKRQIVWLLIGVISMIFVSHIDVMLFKKYSVHAYIVTLILLVLTLLIGFVGNGAQRWISIGPITIQPSEICKLTLVMMLAKYYSDNEDAITSRDRRTVLIKGTIIPCFIMAIPILLVMLQHHLSCIIILGVI